MTEDEMVRWHHLTQWTWVWANSRRRWRTGKPGMLQSKGLQRVRHSWVTEQHNSYNGIVFDNKKKNVKVHATIWLNIKDILLTERIQIHRTVYCMDTFICNFLERQINRDECYISVVTWDWKLEQEVLQRDKKSMEMF